MLVVSAEYLPDESLPRLKNTFHSPNISKVTAGIKYKQKNNRGFTPETACATEPGKEKTWIFLHNLTVNSCKLTPIQHARDSKPSDMWRLHGSCSHTNKTQKTTISHRPDKQKHTALTFSQTHINSWNRTSVPSCYIMTVSVSEQHQLHFHLSHWPVTHVWHFGFMWTAEVEFWGILLWETDKVSAEQRETLRVVSMEIYSNFVWNSQTFSGFCYISLQMHLQNYFYYIYATKVIFTYFHVIGVKLWLISFFCFALSASCFSVFFQLK